MSIRKAVVALALAITGALTTVAPAAAAPTDGKGATADGKGVTADGKGVTADGISTMAACDNSRWRRLIHGQTGLNAVVEPGAPYHVRLQSGGSGYQNFLFCDGGTVDNYRRISFYANGHQQHYLTSTYVEGRVSATGTDPDNNDFWFVCALDAKWVEIKFTYNGQFLGRNSSGYLVAVDNYANGNILWHRSEFSGISLNSC